MSELERALAALGRELDWPPAPDLAARAAGRLEPRRRTLSRRALAPAAAVLVLAIAVAFAVPPARSAILRLLGIGRVTIERVGTLPPARERPLAADLGRPESLAQAARELGFHPLVPPLAHGRVETVYVRDGFLSFVVAEPRPVLVSELTASGPGFVKKLAQNGTTVEQVSVGGAPGLWVAGAEHVVYLPSLPPRYARNVLIWQRGPLTLRLEGDLPEAQALRLARTLHP